MINRERMVEEFIQLIGIDSISKNERRMADTLIRKLKEMGYEVVEDGAGKKIGGNTGNLVCTVKGTKAVPTVMLAAHMDTVEPGIGKKPVFEGNTIKSDGTTVLGGDDASGIVCIFEALRVLKEDKLEHGDIQIVFTVAEEGGLFGSKYMDYSLIHSKYGFILDSDGPIGTVAIKAPSQDKLFITVKGKAAHAGIEPENGISAIQIAAKAISGMKLGRIDFETTANIGVIKGGRETNIICDKVELLGETRSRDTLKREQQTAHMRECFEKAAAEFGSSVEFRAELAYQSYNIPKTAPIMGILQNAAVSAGLELKPEETGGGSDTNNYNANGIEAVDISVGMDKVHSVEERILIDDMVKAAEFVLSIVLHIE